MTAKVLISVEGQTEETFVTQVLRPHFTPRDLWLEPILVKTRRLPNRPADKGGFVPYSRVKKELLSLLGDTSAIAVTTIYDFYALAKSFPGYQDLPQGSGATRAAHLERELQSDITHPKFHPYLQLHEFEALLFADVQTTNELLLGGTHEFDQLRKIKQAFPSPEEIDEEEPPSKRIKTLFPAYEKEADGPLIIMDIDPQHLREQCAHFNQWVAWLESLT